MILVYGEILVDLVKEGNNSFDYFLGGAPFNVAYSSNKIDNNILFIGNVGNDLLGKFILEEVKNKGMDPKFIYLDNEHNTTMAFVEINEDGERSFSFARKHGADYFIPVKALDQILNCDIVHLGSLMLSTKEGLIYANRLIEIAEANKKKISFDINYRSDIYANHDNAIKIYESIYNKCDILKVSLDELYLFTKEDNLEKSLLKFTKAGQKIFVTLGSKGSLLYFDGKIIKESSIGVDVVDTTGAGDAFYGTVLGFINKYGYYEFFKDESTIRRTLKIANIQGALATTKKGALSGVVEIEELLERYEREKR